jgi:pimeloyl-ACP methyl ester carboxylesterase
MAAMSLTTPIHALRTVLGTVGTTSRARVVPDVTGVPQGPPSRSQVVGEVTTPLEAARLLAAGPRLWTEPRGDGHVVIDIPGWRAPELTGLPLRRYLTWLGYDARGWGFGTNVGSPRADARRLTRTVEQLVDRSGRPVSLVGWSLGGVVAREVARSRPELVRCVVTYGTPVVGGSTFTSVAGAAMHELGEATRVAARLHADRPVPVPLTVVYSRRDGVVAWEACLDSRSPDVEHVEVRSTHLSLGVDPDVWSVVARRLHRAQPHG